MWWTGYGNYAGLTGHGNFGPCLVWNDAVTSFVTPSYYMEKILFADNQGSRVLPFVNRSFHCVLSATLDTADLKQDILLKVVNKSDSSETIRIRLEGASQFNPLGNYTMLSADKGAENSLEHPDRVTPVYGTFPAGEDFLYTFPANSITVLGIKP